MADEQEATAEENLPQARPADELARRHFRFGWIALLVFTTLGAVLDSFHAFKAEEYLGVGNETRRLMWTLAHAHGIGLSLIHVAFAATARSLFTLAGPALGFASRLLSWATVLVPVGFFLGGTVTYGGDPGVGVFLVPVGAGVLWLAVMLTAYEVVKAR